MRFMQFKAKAVVLLLLARCLLPIMATRAAVDSGPSS